MRRASWLTSLLASIPLTSNVRTVYTAVENPPPPHAYSHEHYPPLLFMDDSLTVCVSLRQPLLLLRYCIQLKSGHLTPDWGRKALRRPSAGEICCLKRESKHLSGSNSTQGQQKGHREMWLKISRFVCQNCWRLLQRQRSWRPSERPRPSTVPA